METESSRWSVAGECTEACTSPPVCPYYFGSGAPTDLHQGKNQCEGTFTFHITKGHCGEIDLKDLNLGIGFNTGEGGPASKDPWKAILYIDSRADDLQTESLREIFTTCWSLAGEVLHIKRASMTFSRDHVGSSSPPAIRHQVVWGGFLTLKTEPIVTPGGAPRYISGLSGGIIYIGRSTENRYSDRDLPRGNWDRPGMSNTYFDFAINPRQLDWIP